MKLKILLAVHHFPPRYTAGAVLRAYRLAHWLVQQGHQVLVVCIEELEDPDQVQDVGCVEDIYEGIPVQRLFLNLNAWPDAVRWAYDNPNLFKYFQQLLAQEQPDLVHLISGYLVGVAPVRAARDRGIPVIITLADFWFLCPTIQMLKGDGSLCWKPEAVECMRCWLNRWQPFHWAETHASAITRKAPALLHHEYLVPRSVSAMVRRFGERQAALRHALSQVQAIICVTQFTADMHMKNGVPPHLFHVIPYRQASTPTAIPKKGSPDKKVAPVRFAYLGVASPQKGADIVVDAFRRLALPIEQAKLTIFGPITPLSFANKLRQLSRDTPSIQLAGRYDNTRLTEILADVDVVVIPSLWHENAPRTLIEAFQHGKPVIGSNVGGVAALVEDGVNGLLFERGSALSLLRQMQKIIDSPSLLGQLSANIPDMDVGAVENEKVFRVYQHVLHG